MKNNILASIALFGVYRNSNHDTYYLVAQYIKAVIAQKEYVSFTPLNIQEDLKELYHISIPVGVIKSVCRNKIEGITLSKGVFSCTRIPKDEIDKEYNELNEEYDGLFQPLIDFVKSETQDLGDQYIKDSFADYLVEGNISDSRLNNLFAAYVSSNKGDKDFRDKIDLLSSGLISYNGLSYTDTVGNNDTWTDRLVIFLDTEYLFSCAGYNDSYHQAVFQELYDLVNEVNQSYRRRTKKEDDLIELRYLKDTRDVYMGLLAMARGLLETKGAPDPSKKALIKIIQESTSIFDIQRHRAIIDSALKDTYHIIYDDKDYDHFITDPRYVTYDEKTVTELNLTYNPDHDEYKRRKIDYYSRIYTIIKGLRGVKSVSVFEKCRYIFLTGSRIGRGTSLAVVCDNKTVGPATDIDFLVSRLWFKLNKQLVNNRIPISVDIIARSQAVLTREVSRNVRKLYEQLVLKDMSDSEKKSLYSNLKEAAEFLEPYNESSTKDVLAFIEYTNIDELIDAYHKLKKKAEESERKDMALSEAKGLLAQKEEVIAGLKQNIIDQDNGHKQEQIENSEADKRQKKIIKWLSCVVGVLVIALIAVVIFHLKILT